ncbi:MAG: DUF2804 family protein [Thermoleophilaceae bacterium]|nr:DUF2804 family protein [Thermoleophilaceae bacterium]
MPGLPARGKAARELGLPARGPAVRDLGLPLPPQRMPAWRRGALLKRWRYVGIYTPELLLCVGRARIGPFPRYWWAVAEPDGALHQGSSIRREGVTLDGPTVRVEAPGVRIELELEDSVAVETISPAGGRGNYAWTSKRAGVQVRGSVRAGGREHRIDGPHGFVDDSAGYHARHTVWRWSAGLGQTEDGRRVGWNVVTGIHDASEAGERTLWLDGRPRELGAVEFAPDLSRVSFSEGGALEFTEWSARAERTNLLFLRSAYRQPFGTFSGELPGGLRLGEGFGVMEEHDVWW